MRLKKLTLLKCIAIPLGIGVLSAVLSGGGMRTFEALNKPLLSPPGWLFPVVWTILYVLMGVASYLVLTADASQQEKEKALTLYGYQLVVNFLWSIFFFDFRWYLFAFFWLLLLWTLIWLTIKHFQTISRAAALLLVPYLLWVTFAGYLNFAIWKLN